ncbi:MAG: restriction endonuclease subunit S [Peptostreptococcaceae bacterium]
MSNVPKLRFKGFSGDWESKKLGKLGEFKKTYSFSRSVEGEGNYKHIHYGDIHMNYKGIINKDKLIPSIDIPNDDKYEFIQERDIIFADASEDRKDLGKVAVVRNIEGNVLSGLHTFCFRPKEDLNSEFFLNHSLSKEYLKFMYTRGNGAKVLGISKSNLSEYNFLSPSKEEQEKIASFFSLIDDKISLQGKKLEMLKDYKKGMMQKIFNRELRFKDDDGRDYPEWKVTTVENIADLEKGFTPDTKSEKNWIGNIPWLSIADMKQGKYITDVSKHISGDALGKKKLVPKGTLIMSFKLTLGRLAIINRPMITNEAICHFYWKDNNIKTEYMYYYLSTSNIASFGCRAAKGITLNNDSLNSIVVKLPSIEEQNKIADILMKTDDKLKREQEKLDSLNGYKRGLLQQMFV